MADEENGPRFIDKLRERHRRKRREIEVPGMDEVLYATPLTTADVRSVEARMEDRGLDPDKNEHERRALILIQKAELEDGSPAFRSGDMNFLLEEVDYITLQRLFAGVMTSTVDLEEAKKGSATTNGGSDSD